MLLKNNKKPSAKKFIIILVCSLVVVAVASGAWWWMAQKSKIESATKPVNTVDYGPPKERDLNDPTIPQTDAQGEGKDPNAAPPEAPTKLNVTITRADQFGQTVSVRTIIDGTKEGTCTLTATKDQQPSISKSTTITFEVSSANCGFDIPVQEFSQGGTWKLTILAQNNNNSASATQSIDIY